jgi:ribosomal protein L11 methyltransferase
VRAFPAIDISWTSGAPEETLEYLLAELDAASPTAVEERTELVRVFFSSTDARDRAAAIVQAFDASLTCVPLLVPDEAWAERSQADLTAVRIGRVIVAPPWIDRETASEDQTSPLWITIQPSMGFGTGHHPSTRLCVALLQRVALKGQSVLDVGTGSGVLAIAASRLGAREVLAVDLDEDALASARENVDANGVGSHVLLRAMDVTQPSAALHPFDILTANLTGALLVRIADRLTALVNADGTLIVSGFQTDEEGLVRAAFEAGGLRQTERASEQDWIALGLTR